MKNKIQNITREELTVLINSTLELPTELTETIKLYLLGLNPEEVAHRQRLPVSTVRNRLQLAKAYLKQR